MAGLPKIDLSGLEPETEGNAAIDLTGLQREVDPDKDMRNYVQSIFEQNRPIEGMGPDETPSFIKQMWEDVKKAGALEREVKAAFTTEIAVPIAKKIIHISKQGFNQSVFGHAYRLGFDDKELEKIYTESYQNMSTVDRAIYQSAMVAADLPFITAGFILGGGPASPVTAVGGAFALPAGLRKIYADRIEKGDIGTFKEFWDRLTGAVYETGKGEATGIATATVGLSVGAFKLPAEIVTMTAVGAALEGRIPEPQEFLDTAIVIGGLHLSARVSPVLLNIYRKTGKRPEEVVRDMREDPSIKDDIIRAAEDNISEAMPVVGRAQGVGVPEVITPDIIPLAEQVKTAITEMVSLSKKSGRTQLTDKEAVEMLFPGESQPKGVTWIKQGDYDAIKEFIDTVRQDLLSDVKTPEQRQIINELTISITEDIRPDPQSKINDQSPGIYNFIDDWAKLIKSKEVATVQEIGTRDGERLFSVRGAGHTGEALTETQARKEGIEIPTDKLEAESAFQDAKVKEFFPEYFSEITGNEVKAANDDFLLAAVKRAQKDGKVIPPEIKADYPELFPDAEPTPDIPQSYLSLVEKPVSDAPGEAGKTRQRKFLKTVEEAEKTDPELVGKVQEVDPQEYIVEPNVKSLEKAETRIEETGLQETIDYVLSDADLNAEKGATFITLMEKFQKEGDFDRAVEMTEAYDLQLKEAGRFIQAASLWGKSNPASFIRWADRQLESVRTKFGWLDTLFKRNPKDVTITPEEKKVIIERFAEMQEMPEGIEKTDAILQLIDMVAQKVPPSVSELIDTYRYQNMLSSPRTQMRNIGENLGNTFLTRPVDIATRGAIDFVKAGLFGKERQAYVSDVPLYMKTAINSVPNALNAFMAVMRVEKGVEIGKPDIGIDVASEFQRARMAQIPKLLTLVGRFMEASDKFFSTLIGAGEFATQIKNGATEAQAYASAAKLSEKYLYRDRMNPKDPDHLLFSKTLISLGWLMQKSRKTPGLGTISKWGVPFLTTPINKGARMMERSALGGLEVGLRTLFGQKVSPEVYTRAVSGTLVSALATLFVMQGQTTWTAPSDPEAKKLFYESGRKPFSVRIGGDWVPIWYLGPYAFAFGIPMAIKHYTQDDKTAMTKDAVSKILSISEGLVRFIGSQTSTQSIGALFSALSGDIDFTFPATAAFTSSQIIPLTSLIRYINTMIDGVYRKPSGFFESVFKDIPILSKRLESIKESSGKDAVRDPRNFFIPYDIGKDDPKVGRMLKSKMFDVRRNYLRSKMANTIKKVSEGKIKPEKMPDELIKIFKGMGKLGKK